VGEEPALIIEIYHSQIVPDVKDLTEGTLDFHGDDVAMKRVYLFVPNIDFLANTWGKKESEIVDKLYAADNEGTRPWGVRSLSAGDMIVFRYPTHRSGWICEWIGWKHIELGLGFDTEVI